MTEESMQIFDQRVCTLGEGAFWHPLRQQYFWLDIIGKRLLSVAEGEQLQWQFDEHVSAAGWIDHSNLLIASESGLYQFNLEQGSKELLVPLEADKPANRSNDGRADPYGGFWIGTMGMRAEYEQGALYRYYRGELRTLRTGLTIPNAICFAPGGEFAYYADTIAGFLWRQALDKNRGWPVGDAQLLIDFKAQGLNPDGAVTDAEGYIWNAQWGAGRVACYSPQGEFVKAIATPSDQVTCTAFGGDEFTDLLITSATENMTEDQLKAEPTAGKTLIAQACGRGKAEPRVLL